MTRAIAALALRAALGVAASHASAQSRPLVAPEAASIYQRLLQAGITAPPENLAGYLTFVTRVLEDHRRRGYLHDNAAALYK